MRQAILFNVLVGAIVAFIAQKFGYSPMWGFLGCLIFAMFQLIWFYIQVIALTFMVMIPFLWIVLTWMNGHRDPRQDERR